jgi:hypothetical protein
MPDEMLDRLDDKVALVLYFETEEAANAALVDPHLLHTVRQAPGVSTDVLRRMYEVNRTPTLPPVEAIALEALYDHMIATQTLRLAVVISGQGPEAFGMPEMCVPSFRINYNRVLRPLVTLITDGRYSGTNWGAAVGHVTPEAIRGGGIAYLQTGDLLLLRFRAGRLDLLDQAAFLATGTPAVYGGDLAAERATLAGERRAHLQQRARQIAPANRMLYHTDAARGVVPLQVAEAATVRWVEPAPAAVYNAEGPAQGVRVAQPAGA